MKYPIDKELKSLSKYSGAMVVRLYPFIKIGYRLKKCRSDKDVTGDSAGGNIAGAVTVMLKDRKQDLPKGVMMIYPVLDKRMVTESMKKYTDTPIWDSRCNKLFWEMYLKDQDVSQTRYASISEINSLDFFPDTYIEVAEFDCLILRELSGYFVDTRRSIWISLLLRDRISANNDKVHCSVIIDQSHHWKP